MIKFKSGHLFAGFSLAHMYCFATQIVVVLIGGIFYEFFYELDQTYIQDIEEVKVYKHNHGIETFTDEQVAQMVNEKVDNTNKKHFITILGCTAIVSGSCLVIAMVLSYIK
jgi:hypothetical protein